MLDVIVTISDTTPHEWVDQAIVSVNIAAEDAGYPVNVFLVPGVPGHIGQAMANGFRRTSAPYVAWVDDDDFLLPDALAPFRAPLEEAQALRICGREIHLLANERSYEAQGRHHLTAFRRDIVAGVGLTRYPAIPNIALHKAAEHSTVDLLHWGYVRRMRLSGGERLRAHLTAEEKLL